MALVSLVCLACAPPLARATTLSYDITIESGKEGVAEISFLLADFPYAETDIVLAEPVGDPEQYFLFFESLRFESGEGKEIFPTRTSAGLVHFTGVSDTLRGSYRVRIAELATALGGDIHAPMLTSERTVLPARALLAVPVEVDTKGLVFERLSVALHLPEGWRLLTPFRTYRGEVSLTEGGVNALRNAVFASGTFALRNDLEGVTGSLRLYSGGTPAAMDSLDAALTKLLVHYTGVFSTPGVDAPFIVVEFDDAARPTVLGRGASIRIQVPQSLVLEPQRPYGSAAYAFYHSLAHEVFHRWLGVAGVIVPLGAETYWLSEGAAQYLGALALARSGIAGPETVLAFLSEVATAYRAMPDRAAAIDGPRARYESDPAYRSLVSTKGVLACFLLDTQLMRASEPSSLPLALRKMFYTAFMKDRKFGAFFSEAELADALVVTLGLRGKLLVNSFVRTDLYDQLLSRPAEVGLRVAEEGGSNVLVSAVTEQSYYRRSLLP